MSGTPPGGGAPDLPELIVHPGAKTGAHLAAPSSPTDHGPDIAVRGWAAITVRVAWALHRQGVRVTREAMVAAREHVLFYIDPHASVDEAEDIAERRTGQFVARLQHKPWTDPYEDAPAMPSRRWRQYIEDSLTQLGALVLRYHYAQGQPLTKVAQTFEEDVHALDAVREGLREVVRRARKRDGAGTPWEDARVDAALHRLAGMGAPEPPLLEVVDRMHPGHESWCIRSYRALKLVDAGLLVRSDLIPPPDAVRRHREPAQLTVLAVGLKQPGRHGKRLVKGAPGRVVPLMGGVFAMRQVAHGATESFVLKLVAGGGVPRHTLRGARVHGVGAWSSHGLLGPLADRLGPTLDAVPWGEVQGVGELPARRPRGAMWATWAPAAAILVLLLGLLSWALSSPPAVGPLPLQVELLSARGGFWVAFDAPDVAYVALVRERAGELELLLPGLSRSGKVAYGVGDGSYRLHVPGDGVLVVSSPTPLTDLPAALRDASVPTLDEVSRGGHALERLARAIEQVEGRNVHVARLP